MSLVVSSIVPVSIVPTIGLVYVMGIGTSGASAIVCHIVGYILFTIGVIAAVANSDLGA